MANEISGSVGLTVTKNGAVFAFNKSKTLSMTGTRAYYGVQNIGTSAETVAFGDVSGTPQKVAICNLDSTNYVEFGGDSGLTVFKIKLVAGDSMIITPTSATLYAKANTGAVDILVEAVEA